MSSCACYEASIKACSSSLVLKAGLAANTSYFWLIENKFGKIFQRQVETDADGLLTIDLTLLPAGSGNEFSGHYTLSLREGANYLNKVSMTLSGKVHECVSFNFIAMDDEPENAYNVIQ